MADFPSLSSYFHKTKSILLDRKELSNRTDCFHGNMQFSKYMCFACLQDLCERQALELNRKTREQFSRIRLGFFVNKRTDIKLVAARGSCLKFSISKLHGNVFMGKKNVQFPQQKPVSGNVLRKVTCYSFTVTLIDLKCFLLLRIQNN